jgi:DNA-binding XRE family transcriptional regulator
MRQTDLARAVGVSNKTISSWEVERTEPNMGDLERLSAALHCEKTDIIDGQIERLEAYSTVINTLAMPNTDSNVTETDLANLFEMKKERENKIESLNEELKTVTEELYEIEMQILKVKYALEISKYKKS